MNRYKERVFAKPEPWSRLDNAAKLFPSTSEKTDTRVFRFSCELYENIDIITLQEAVDIAADNYPVFLSIMRKGFFWYYLEHCELKPIVTEEKLPVCSQIYDPEKKELLFRISCFKNCINLEVYHVLADGTGALGFLKDIVYNYLLIKYPDEYKTPPLLDNDASNTQKSDDSFRRYYDKETGKTKKEKKAARAYNLTGDKHTDERLRIIEGIASVKSIKEAAHKYNTTITVFLTALFIQAIRKEMPLSGLKYPVVINVPVNLRPYFPSETARNFFGMISVPYDFGKRDGTTDDIISEVNACFKRELTKERLAIRMNQMASIEHNPFARIAPLPFKNLVLNRARHIRDRSQTAVISNIGRITMPAEMEHHIKQFGILISTLGLQMCMCSFCDRMQIGFTTSYISTDIQRSFFRSLTSLGIEVEIRSNDFYSDDE